FTIFALFIFFLLAILYALFEARGQILGPTIDVSPRVELVHQPFLVIQGQAERISSLLMNGQQIPVTENGSFQEPYLLPPGYNRIVLDAKDSYGRSAERVLEIMYQPEPGSATPTTTASSTPESSSTAPVAPTS